MSACSPFESELLRQLPGVRRFAMHLVKRAADADDLAQETALKALLHRDKFIVGTNMRAWLCLICRNICYTAKRRSWRWCEMDDTWSAAIPGADSPHHYLALKELLEAVAYLPAEQSEALLAVALGQDYDEIAQALGCEVGTVKSRVSRARDSIDLYFAAAA